MDLVIDISEYNKEWIKNTFGIPEELNVPIARAIMNGRPPGPDVIRCKECKYLRQNYFGITYCDRSGVDNNGDYIDRISYGWDLDDFCSHAERRNDRDERSV